MKNTYKKLIAVTLIFLMLAISCPSPVRAGYWGEDWAATTWQTMYEQIYKTIQDALLANMKMAALRVIQSRMSSLLGKSSGSSSSGLSGMIISNWQSFIYKTAQSYSTQVTSDFFNSLSSGASSTLKSKVLTPANSAATADSISKAPNLDSYLSGGDPSKIFTSGATTAPWKAWNVASQPQNDLAFNLLRILAIKEAAFQVKSESQKTEGLAGQGYASKKTGSSSTSSGSSSTETISAPGSSIKSIQDKIQGMPIDMVALARTIPEVATAMGIPRFLDSSRKEISPSSGFKWGRQSSL